MLDGDPRLEEDLGELVRREIGRRRVITEPRNDVVDGELGRFAKAGVGAGKATRLFEAICKVQYRAELWVEPVGDQYGVDTNQTGTFLHLSTDQVRFVPIGEGRTHGHASGGGYQKWYGGTEIAIGVIPANAIIEGSGAWITTAFTAGTTIDIGDTHRKRRVRSDRWRAIECDPSGTTQSGK